MSGRPQGNDVSFWPISSGSLNRDFNQLDDRITINYGRVSSDDQKADLVRQGQVLEAFSATNGWQFETIQDLGSGLNYNKRGLQKLLKRIMQGDVGRLVLTHKDRLLTLGAELVHGVTTPSKRPYPQGHSPQNPLKKW